MYIYGYHILFYASVAATLGVSAFGLWKGDAPVRYAAVTLLAVEPLHSVHQSEVSATRAA